MSVLLTALLVLFGDIEQLISWFSALVIGLNFPGCGLGLLGMVDGTSLVRGSDKMCSAEFLF